MNTIQPLSRLVPALIAMCSAACAPTGDDLDVTIVASSTPPPGTGAPGGHCGSLFPTTFISSGQGCSPNDCGTNSAYVNGYPVDELHLWPQANTGQANHAGIRIVDYVAPGGQPAWLHAQHGELYAVIATGAILVGDQLVGSKIVIEDTNTGDQDVLVIYEYEEDVSWVSGSTVPVHNYLFTYDSTGTFDVNDPWCNFRTPVCTVAAESSQYDLTWAAIVTGERYQHAADHQVLPSVSPSSGNDWFNIACQGNALNKMRRLEYDPDPGPGGVAPTKRVERQATLRMITADYCGIGKSFTENGVEVAWANASGTVDTNSLYEQDDLQVEAIWTLHGALCLDQTRLPDVAEKVEALCPALVQAESCAELLAETPDPAALGEWVTSVPMSP